MDGPLVQNSRQPLLRVTVLGLAWLAGFCSRLFAVIRFESIIHEFDPWYVPTTGRPVCGYPFPLFLFLI